MPITVNELLNKISYNRFNEPKYIKQQSQFITDNIHNFKQLNQALQILQDIRFYQNIYDNDRIVNDIMSTVTYNSLHHTPSQTGKAGQLVCQKLVNAMLTSQYQKLPFKPINQKQNSMTFTSKDVFDTDYGFQQSITINHHGHITWQCDTDMDYDIVGDSMWFLEQGLVETSSDASQLDFAEYNHVQDMWDVKRMIKQLDQDEQLTNQTRAWLMRLFMIKAWQYKINSQLIAYQAHHKFAPVKFDNYKYLYPTLLSYSQITAIVNG